MLMYPKQPKKKTRKRHMPSIMHHRTGPEAVHVDAKSMRLIQQDVQREYEKTHTRQQFRALIGKNFLEE